MGVRYIGAEVQRMEDPRLLKGVGCYVDDITKNGMLHVAFVLSLIHISEPTRPY